MKNDFILELKSVSKHFQTEQGHTQVINDFSLAVRSGETVALVGPSGCGKTTLLNIIAEIILADQGELVRKAQNKMAYVFQESRLLPWKTVDENIAFVQQNYMSLKNAEQVRIRLLEKTGLLAYKDAYPAQLSGGMKQRVEFARALAIKPDLLLMDEAFKSLDVALKCQLREVLLKEQRRKKFAILFVTHDPEEAVLLSDRVIILSDKPTTIQSELVLTSPRASRDLRNEIIYNKVQMILAAIMEK